MKEKETKTTESEDEELTEKELEQTAGGKLTRKPTTQNPGSNPIITIEVTSV